MPPTRPNVFVSHASDDKPRLGVLIEKLLDAGLTVWIDQPRKAGLRRHPNLKGIRLFENWSSSIETNLTTSDCVLVVWSHSSAVQQRTASTSKRRAVRRRENVHEEARRGKEADKLIQIAIDPLGELELPYGFQERQQLDLSEDFANGDLSEEALADLMADIQFLIDRGTVGEIAEAGAVTMQEVPDGIAQRPSSAREWLLPYAVDRVPHEAYLGRELFATLPEQAQTESRVVAITIAGPREELHDKFVKIANRRVIRDETSRFGFTEGWRFINVPWPDADQSTHHLSAEDRLQAYLSRVGRKLGLSARLTYASPEGLAVAVSKWMEHNGEPLALFSRLPECSKTDALLFKDCLDWWATVRTPANRMPIAKVFFFYTPYEHQAKSWLRGYRSESDRVLAKLDPDGRSDIKIIKIPKLGQITHSNVIEWIDLVKEQADDYWSEETKKVLEARAERLFQDTERCSLKHVASELERALEHCRINPDGLDDRL